MLCGGENLQDMDLIYKEHAKSVFKYLVSLSRDIDLAEELTQETFYRAIYSLDTYNGSCKVSVWLCQIAKHIWYQELEKQKSLALKLLVKICLHPKFHLKKMQFFMKTSYSYIQLSIYWTSL